MTRRIARLSLSSLLAVAALASPALAVDDPAVDALAGGCYATAGVQGGPFTFQATALGRFMLLGADGRLLGTAGGPEAAGPAAEWAVTRAGAAHAFSLRNTASGTLVKTTLAAAGGCQAYPEAGVDATGTPARSQNADGTIRGFVDTHVHITADQRAGGDVISGEPFDRFGITHALGQDAAVHGADGGLDYTGNLLRDGVPFGTHDTGGWPTFAGWPTNDTNTHQQVYWRWLQRAWLAGLRLTVAQTVEDAPICHIEPRRRHGCDETAAIRRQIATLHGLQDYVDAQSGGIGKGWLRIVEDPASARRVMAAGKLAVVIGMESSFPLDCRDQVGRPRCTTRQVDRRLDALYHAGVRSMFIAHWADNGFAGAALEGGVKGKFINAMQRVETGRWFSVGRCPDPSQGEQAQGLAAIEIKVLSDFFPATKKLAAVKEPAYPMGRRCNARGLTPLGRHLVRRMMAKGMLIEVDHLSEKARDAVLAMARAARYPLVSSHNGTGGLWTPRELRRLVAVGGVASQRPAGGAELARAIVARARSATYGVGLGTDTGGFATLPGPAADAASDPLRYPFSLDGVTFDRQQTGQRTFDLNTDGVAHYGLMADLIADMARRPQGRRAETLLFRSAEGYLRMWQRAVRRR